MSGLEVLEGLGGLEGLEGLNGLKGLRGLTWLLYKFSYSTPSERGYMAIWGFGAKCWMDGWMDG